MMSISSNVLFVVCALILLGLHFETYQVDARSFSLVSEGNYVVENQLTDHVIEHPKRHIRFSWPKPKRVPDLAPPFSLGILTKDVLTPPSENELGDNIVKHPKSHIRFSWIWPRPKRVPDLAPPFSLGIMSNHLRTPPLENELGRSITKHPKRHIRFSWPKPKRVPDLAPPFSLGILSKDVRAPPSGSSQRTLDNNPSPPSHALPIILHKESRIKFGILPKGARVPPSGPSVRT
uniref:Uncharacterized protein n=2 Tax=Cucumis melo TaxID=3656 RepID=A0A9I9DX24_CUCME